MITETFLNSCYGLLFGPRNDRLDMSDYRDLLTFFEQSKKHFYEGDLPVDVINKQQLIQKTCEHMIKGGTMVELITSISVSQKYKENISLIKLYESGQLNEPDHGQWRKTIQKLIAFCRLNTTFKQFDKYREIVRDGTFDTIDEVITEFVDIVKTASSTVADYELKTRSDLVSSFNTRSDGVDSIIREIKKNIRRPMWFPAAYRSWMPNF